MSGASCDFILLLICLLLVGYLETSSIARVQDVNLSDSSFGYPHVDSIVSDRVLLVGVVLVSTLTFAIGELKSRKDRHYALLAATFFLGLLESVVFTVLTTNSFKILIGRPRPYFAAVCEGYISGSTTVCSGNAHEVNEARKSFPSGHSSLSFATAVYLMGYIGAKLRLGKLETNGVTWRIVVTFIPALLAGLVAASRTIDYHHHFSDVIGGSVLGTFIASVVVFARRPAILKRIEDEAAGVEYTAIAV